MRKRLCCLLTVCMAGIGLFGCTAKGELPTTAEQEPAGEIIQETKADASVEAQSADTGNYTLQCIDAVYGTVLPDAEVCILDGEGREAARGNTDAQGMLQMELAEGSYQAEVKKDGYYTEQKNVEVEADGKQDRIRLVSAFEEDKYLVMLEWDGNEDLDLMMFDADKNQYIGKGNPTDDNGSFLYADNDAEQGYELFSAAKAEGIRTFYVKDHQGAAEASSQMEADGVTAKVYAPEGLIQTMQADRGEDAALWIPFYLYQGEVQGQDEYVHDLKEHKEALYDQEALKAYQAFLDGEESAVSLADNKKSSMNDLIHQVETNEDDSGDYIIKKISYAYMDVGNDNMPELQILFDGDISDSGMMFQGYFVLSYQDAALRIIDTGWGEYRQGEEINYYGIISYGGSSGASSGGEKVFVLGTDGQRKELYDYYYYFYGVERGEIDGLENHDILLGAWIIDGKNYLTYDNENEISSADKEKCLKYVSSVGFYFWSDHSEIKEVSQEEIDTLIEQKAKNEGVLNVWKAEAPELEWHEWKLPQAGQPEGMETWKYNYLMKLKDYFQGKEYFVTFHEGWTYQDRGGFFSLEDINNDGKKELFISGSYGEDYYDSVVYMYDTNGKVKEIEVDELVTGYNSDKGLIKSNTGNVDLEMSVYSYDGIDVKLVIGFLNISEAEEYYKKTDYDYVQITKEEFDSLMAQYDESNFHWQIPEFFDFTIENIEDAFNVNITNRYGDWIITNR